MHPKQPERSTEHATAKPAIGICTATSTSGHAYNRPASGYDDAASRRACHNGDVLMTLRLNVCVLAGHGTVLDEYDNQSDVYASAGTTTDDRACSGGW